MLTAADLLQALLAGGPLPGRHLLVTAHPDDETISASAILCDAADVRILQVTHGVPPGAANLDAMALQRVAERRAAALAAGWAYAVTELGGTSRTVQARLVDLVCAVRSALVDVDVVWTHPYEGGHLDHDSCAWAVATACAGTAVLSMEFASYYGTPTGLRPLAFGVFWPNPSVPAVAVPLRPAVWARKQAAMRAYRSQAHILAKFAQPSRECYRAAPRYDFTKPPPPDICRWDSKKLQPTTAHWRQSVAQATQEITR